MNDANGSMTADESGRIFVYDAWNRLAAVRNSSNSPIVTYSIDALGRRITEDRPNANTVDHLYYSTGWQVLEERRGGAADSNIRRQYFWSIDYVDALTTRLDYASGAVSATYHAQYDANWNITAIADATSGVLERYIYDPYGAATVLYANGTVRGGSPYGWDYLHQGGRFDVDSNLYHFRHRDYSATLGRWTQTDPIGFDAGDFNLYRYVGNSPVDTLDPSGWKRKWWGKAGEIIRGVWEVGPIDAWDVGYGYIGKDAVAFQSECYPDPKPDKPDEDIGWKRNAARHAYWMAMITAIHGDGKAKAIGYAHEFGSDDYLDNWIDLYNNERARVIGKRAFDDEKRRSKKCGEYFSWDGVESDIKRKVRIGLKDGTFIIGPNDPRIPRNLRPIPGGGSSYNPRNYNRRYRHGKYDYYSE